MISCTALRRRSVEHATTDGLSPKNKFLAMYVLMCWIEKKIGLHFSIQILGEVNLIVVPKIYPTQVCPNCFLRK